jgi:hypothetical protein
MVPADNFTRPTTALDGTGNTLHPRVLTVTQARARHAPSNSAAAKGLDGAFGHPGGQRGNGRGGGYCGTSPYPQVIARTQRPTFLAAGGSGLAELNEGRRSPPVESRQNQVRWAVSSPPRSWPRREGGTEEAPGLARRLGCWIASVSRECGLFSREPTVRTIGPPANACAVRRPLAGGPA